MKYEPPLFLIHLIRIDCLLSAKLCAVNLELMGIRGTKDIARATPSPAQLHPDFPTLSFLPFAIVSFFYCMSYTNSDHLKKICWSESSTRFITGRYEDARLMLEDEALQYDKNTPII